MLGAGERHASLELRLHGRQGYFFALSGCILLIGSLALATKGLNFGIDFESGTRVTATLERSDRRERCATRSAPLGLSDAKIQQVKNKPDSATT